MNYIITTIKNLLNKGFLHLFTANIFVSAIEFGAQIFVAFLLFEDDIGRIKSFQSFAAIALILTNLGFNTSTLKYASEKRSIENKENLYSTALISTLIFGFFTFALIIILSYFGLISNDSITNKLFIFYALSIPTLAINNLSIAYIQALKKFKEVSILLIALRISQVLIILLFTYFFKLQGFVFGIILGFLISSIFIVLQTKVPLKKIKFKIEVFKEHWKLAKFSFLANLVSSLNAYLDIIIINKFIVDEKEFGYYGMALTLITALRVLTTTIQQYLTPFYSEYSSNPKQHYSFFKKSLKLFIPSSFLLSILIIALSPFVISFIFDHKYDSSIFYFQLLVVSWFIRNIYSLIGIYFLSLSKININFYNTLIALIISIFPIYYLILKYNTLGAAYSHILTATISAIIVLISYFNFRRNEKSI